MAVEVPKYGKLDYLGRGWECLRGYYQAGQKRVAIQIQEIGKPGYPAVDGLPVC